MPDATALVESSQDAAPRGIIDAVTAPLEAGSEERENGLWATERVRLRVTPCIERGKILRLEENFDWRSHGRRRSRTWDLGAAISGHPAQVERSGGNTQAVELTRHQATAWLAYRPKLWLKFRMQDDPFLPTVVDVRAAQEAQEAFKAAGIADRIARVLIYGVGLRSPTQLKTEPWEDTPGSHGLRWKLSLTPGVGPKLLAQIEGLRNTM